MSKKPFPSETQDRFIVRLPDGMRERLKREAEHNGRSMNAEIVQRLTSTLETDDFSREPGSEGYTITLKVPGDLVDRIRETAIDNHRPFQAEVVHSLTEAYPDLMPINDLIDMMNRALADARRSGDLKSLDKLERSISDVGHFYTLELHNKRVKPDLDYELTKLNVTDSSQTEAARKPRG